MTDRGQAPPATDDDTYARTNARLTSAALRHVAPEHVGRALDHYAKNLQRAVRKGKLTGEQVDALADEHHDGAFAQVAKDNPEIARGYQAPAARVDPTAGKTFAPGKANSLSEREARAEMRKRGISY